MTNILVIAKTTHNLIARQAFYYFILLLLAVLIYFSRMLTLFAFNLELNMIREMGIATLSLWGIIILIITSGPIIIQELEDRTAVTLLSKPLRKSEFLLGKFFGIYYSILLGLIFLTLILILTLWLFVSPILLDAKFLIFLDAYKHKGLTMGGYLWQEFFLGAVVAVLEGALLGALQIAVLSAICVSVAAFFPMLVTAATTALVYIIGNLSVYMMTSIQKLDFIPLTYIAKIFYYIIPNFSYFNLQTAFSEGRVISLKYLIFSTCYGIIYCVLVLFIASAIFNRREVR